MSEDNMTNSNIETKRKVKITFEKLIIEEEDVKEVREDDSTNTESIYYQSAIPSNKDYKPHRWEKRKKGHLTLISLLIAILILIIIFSFNPIVIGLGILGSIASIIGLIKEVPSSIEANLDIISKKLKQFNSIKPDRLIL
jgi:Na+/H+ antiporter NhaC